MDYPRYDSCLEVPIDRLAYCIASLVNDVFNGVFRNVIDDIELFTCVENEIY